MRYRVILEVSEEGYSVHVPGLPGCCSQGQTEAEALDNIKIAIAEYLAVVDELSSGQIVREVDVTV
jgi:predicted RNase H-like HicB family nuclease